MSKLHYLTVQDVLWINLQLTKKVQKFNAVKLEEATFYQYAYGDSNSLGAQAARFMVGFPRVSPIDGGNVATAFASGITFLAINGVMLSVSDKDGADFFDEMLQQRPLAAEILDKATECDADFHHTGSGDIRSAAQQMIEKYPVTLAKLLKK
jgi:prophage maintenance system killer protein